MPFNGNVHKDNIIVLRHFSISDNGQRTLSPWHFFPECSWARKTDNIEDTISALSPFPAWNTLPYHPTRLGRTCVHPCAIRNLAPLRLFGLSLLNIGPTKNDFIDLKNSNRTEYVMVVAHRGAKKKTLRVSDPRYEKVFVGIPMDVPLVCDAIWSSCFGKDEFLMGGLNQNVTTTVILLRSV